MQKSSVNVYAGICKWLKRGAFLQKSIVLKIGKLLIKEAAEKWNLSVRRVQTICNEGMIQGTIKFGHAWAIPKDAEKPADKRIKTKKYMKR